MWTEAHCGRKVLALQPLIWVFINRVGEIIHYPVLLFHKHRR